MFLDKVSVIILLIALRQRLVEGIDEKKLFSSEIEIHAPESLKGFLHHRGALFGSFPTGITLQAPLYYTRRKLCGDETPNTPDFVIDPPRVSRIGFAPVALSNAAEPPKFTGV